MKSIILLPSGAVTQSELKDLKEAGYVPIITDEPEHIKIINQEDSGLLGVTEKDLLGRLMHIVFNYSDGMSQRDWLMRILLSDMGAQPAKK